METENRKLLGKHVDVQMKDFHLYGVLKAIEENGIWLETNEQESFINWTNITMIKKDRKYIGDCNV
jgi:hypothetical protein